MRYSARSGVVPMNKGCEIFDAARLELKRGVNLVEASAGTGKTYAIGMLVLRALVELGVPIEKILIVTFTKAATEELKTRIRARLVEARELLGIREGSASGTVDQTLSDWLSTIKDPKEAFLRLQVALYDIDRAGIFTIHGFCQRMLVEQALESGQLFDVELLADISQIRSEVADDFWRSRIYVLEPLPCSIVTGCFNSPDKLLASVAAVFGDNGRLEPEVNSLDAGQLQLKRAMEQLALWWSKKSNKLHGFFAASLPGGNFKKSFTENFANWFQTLTDFFSGNRLAVPENIHLLGRQALQEELNGTRIRGQAKKEAYLADWPLPDIELDEFLAAIENLILSFRVKLAENLRSEVGHRLDLRCAMGFNDLILRLSRALQDERGQLLKKMLGDRFSVALIDEFQDTDSSQWHIFSTLFGDLEHFLYLIGDPKQAIYKFRGADIHSYFLARESAHRLLTLEKNYRSHPLLVQEVNALFSGRLKPFLFEESILEYRCIQPAKARGEIDLLGAGRSLAGMVYCTLPPEPEEKNGRWTSGKAAAMFRLFIVAEIGRLLDPSDPVVLKTKGQRTLAPHDIAILVRSNRQAEEYRQALVDAGIQAVVGSRTSVFETEECREMLLLLLAVSAPGEADRLKTALSISWFGFTGYELHELWQDEEMFSRYHSRFLQYNICWQEQGFLAMMSRLLLDEEVLPTLAKGRMAERAIANIQHLLELVQEQENSENLGVGQILQWLRKMMQGDRSTENAELLLESDEEAVRIVTMHSAKGLEYPVVFCPYLWYSSDRLKGEKYQISCHDDDHRLVIDLGSEQFTARREKAVTEEKAEELRLLYVALTRAKLRCYVGWADVKQYSSVGDCFQSALGYLLFPDGPVASLQQHEMFSGLARKRSVEHLIVALDESQAECRSTLDEEELHPMVSSGRSLQTDWQMSSFSAMAALSEYDHEADPGTAKAPGAVVGQAVPVPDLPAGPNFGNVIHDLLEGFPFSAIGNREQEESLSALLRQKCTRYGVETGAGDVIRLLDQVVSTPLAAGSFRLAELSETKCLKEMGFYFHLSRLTTERINSLLADEEAVAPLSHKVMRGYLTGFVDLICQHGNKYYILDYKTNYLGELMSDYQSDRLVEAMQSHNYGLQYWIYTLVLHRHLQNVLPGYRYHDHFGGVRYLFVRGMNRDFPGSGVYATTPDYNKLQELDRLIGGEDE